MFGKIQSPVRTGAMRRAKLSGPFSVRLDEEVRKGIQALADADDRSFSSYLNRLCREHLEAKRAEAAAKKAEKPAEGKPGGKRRA